MTNRPSPVNRETALKNVNALINAEPSPEYFAEFMDQVRHEANPRGAAIMTATNTENLLRYALSRRLTVSKDSYRELFRSPVPWQRSIKK